MINNIELEKEINDIVKYFDEVLHYPFFKKYYTIEEFRNYFYLDDYRGSIIDVLSEVEVSDNFIE